LRLGYSPVRLLLASLLPKSHKVLVYHPTQLSRLQPPPLLNTGLLLYLLDRTLRGWQVLNSASLVPGRDIHLTEARSKPAIYQYISQVVYIKRTMPWPSCMC
jgi:hypothetical protein